MHLRTVTAGDRSAIQRVYASAFPEDERAIVSRLAVDLLAEASTPPVIALVAEAADAVVGHVAFSPVTIKGRPKAQGYILAPLAVTPAYQKRRLGTQLVKQGMQRLLEQGVDIVFVYGDPAYYGRFGFNVLLATRYIPPYELQYPSGWQAVALTGLDAAGTPRRIDCVRSLRDPRLW